MLRRLVYLAIASLVMVSSLTALLGYFSDVQPVASPEPQSIWRFEAAFLLTAVQWIGIAVMVVAFVAIPFVANRSRKHLS